MSHIRISRARRGVQMLAIASGLLVSGCLRSTAPQPSVIQLNGTWKYTGVQTQPVRENLTGTLTISRESGASFQGRVDLVAANEQSGQNTVLGGLVSGTESDGNVIDFDADLETVRRHVGQIVADTITGTWIGSASNGIMSSGTFRVERETQ
ncbi:MAG TPA: hypothetical protein VGL17_05780 [Gemmatimonadaceae bacterium]